MGRILTFNHKIINPGNNRYFGSFGSGPGPTPPTPPEPTVYDVILTTDGHGSISANPMSGVKDTLITLSNTPAQNYVFSKYTLNNVDLAGNTFLMPEADANVKGWFEADMRTITITQPSHGTITAPASAQVGSTVTLSITTDTGYDLQYFTVNGSQIQGNSFVMPASNVTVSASIVGASYTISVTQPSNGTITAPASATAGSTVTLSCTPASGYELNFFMVNGSKINGSSFTMPDHDVTVSASVALTMSSRKIGNYVWSTANLQIDDGQSGIKWDDGSYGAGVIVEHYYTQAAAQRIANSVQGWHLPTSDELYNLINTAGGVGEASTSTKLFTTLCGGTDNYGFGATKAGFMESWQADGASGAGIGGYDTGFYLWTSTFDQNNRCTILDMNSYAPHIYSKTIYDEYYSLRLVKDY